MATKGGEKAYIESRRRSDGRGGSSSGSRGGHTSHGGGQKSEARTADRRARAKRQKELQKGKAIGSEGRVRTPLPRATRRKAAPPWAENVPDPEEDPYAEHQEGWAKKQAAVDKKKREFEENLAESMSISRSKEKKAAAADRARRMKRGKSKGAEEKAQIAARRKGSKKTEWEEIADKRRERLRGLGQSGGPENRDYWKKKKGSVEEQLGENLLGEVGPTITPQEARKRARASRDWPPSIDEGVEKAKKRKARLAKAARVRALKMSKTQKPPKSRTSPPKRSTTAKDPRMAKVKAAHKRWRGRQE